MHAPRCRKRQRWIVRPAPKKNEIFFKNKKKQTKTKHKRALEINETNPHLIFALGNALENLILGFLKRVFFASPRTQNRFHFFGFFRVFFCSFFFFVRLPRGRRWPSTIGRCAGPDENAIKKQMSPGLPIEEKSKRSPQKK